jgi:hypothetical protein
MKPWIFILEPLPVHAKLVLFIDGDHDADNLYGIIKRTEHRELEKADAFFGDLRAELVHVAEHPTVRYGGVKPCVESIDAGYLTALLPIPVPAHLIAGQVILDRGRVRRVAQDVRPERRPQVRHGVRQKLGQLGELLELGEPNPHPLGEIQLRRLVGELRERVPGDEINDITRWKLNRIDDLPPVIHGLGRVLHGFLQSRLLRLIQRRFVPRPIRRGREGRRLRRRDLVRVLVGTDRDGACDAQKREQKQKERYESTHPHKQPLSFVTPSDMASRAHGARLADATVNRGRPSRARGSVCSSSSSLPLVMSGAPQKDHKK